MAEQEIFFYDVVQETEYTIGESISYFTDEIGETPEAAIENFIKGIRQLDFSYLKSQSSERIKIENGNVYYKSVILTLSTTTKVLAKVINTFDSEDFIVELVNIYENWVKICTIEEYTLEKFNRE